MTEPKPKVYAPEGSIFQLGKDVLDGWEGRWNLNQDCWFNADYCRKQWPWRIMEVRQIPEKTVVVEIPEKLVREAANSFWARSAGIQIGTILREAAEKLDD